MVHYARFRPRLTKLTFAWIWLGIISAGISFASTYEMSPWLAYAIWSAAAVMFAFLFLLPALRFSATYLDLLSTGIDLRLGLGAARRIELGWADISSVTASPIKGIILKTRDENEYVLRGYANQRAIVSEMNLLLGGK